MNFEVSNMRVLDNMGVCKALFDITFDKSVLVYDAKLLKLSRGWVVCMPSRKRGTDFVEHCKILSKTLSALVLSNALEIYAASQPGHAVRLLDAPGKPTNNKCKGDAHCV